MAVESNTELQLPRWKCHKEVNAAKITRVENTSMAAVLHLEGGSSVKVDWHWLDLHRPKAGGYYVVNKEGFSSFLRAEAFEAGYARI